MFWFSLRMDSNVGSKCNARRTSACMRERVRFNRAPVVITDLNQLHRVVYLFPATLINRVCNTLSFPPLNSSYQCQELVFPGGLLVINLNPLISIWCCWCQRGNARSAPGRRTDAINELLPLLLTLASSWCQQSQLGRWRAGECSVKSPV